MIKALDFFSMGSKVKVYISVLCFCIGFLAHGQRKKADELFSERAYVEAIEAYKDSDPSKAVLQNLADSYFHTGDLQNAEKQYATLFDKYGRRVPQEYVMRYSHVLKGLGRYIEADSLLRSKAGLNVNTDSLSVQLDKILPHKYLVQEVKNSQAGDFGTSFYKDTVVFSSIRTKSKSNYKWNDKPYLDLYMAELTDEVELVDIRPFSKEINTETHESNATFTPNGKVMFFSRTNEKRVEINGQKVAHVKIWKAELIDGEWQNVEVMPFSSDLYSTQHPYLDKQEPKLYFSSDMEEAGNFDLYYVTLDGKGGSSKPVKLPESINTEHREHFPFIDAAGSLYYASDRPEGYGGLDIYFCRRRDDGSFTSPINLGPSVNSGRDDFSYYYSDYYDKGFLSSTRSGTDKLYYLQRLQNERSFVIKGKVRDAITGEPLTGATITLRSAIGEFIEEFPVEDADGYKFQVEPNTTYQIEGYRPFYITKLESLTTVDEGVVEFDIELMLESYDSAEEIVVTDQNSGKVYVQLENIYFDLDKWNIKPEAARTLDVLVDLLKKYPRMSVQLGAHTDSRNSEAYNLRLSKNRAQATMDYLIEQGIDPSRLTSKGYGESVPLVPCGDDCTELEHSINRRCEFLILR